MSSVVESFPEPFRGALIAEVGTRDPELLSALRECTSPSLAQKKAVEEILLDRFLSELGPDYEPTERGKRASRAIAILYEQWPNDAE